jgi:hypothetical protein
MTIIAMQHQGFFLALSTDENRMTFWLTGMAMQGSYGGFVHSFDNFQKAYEEWVGVSEMLVEGA